MKTLALLTLSLAVALVMPAPVAEKSSTEVKVKQELKKETEVKVEQKPKEEPEVKVEQEPKEEPEVTVERISTFDDREGTEGAAGVQIYVVPETDERTLTSQGERYFLTIGGKGYHILAEPKRAEEYEAIFGDGHLASITPRVIREDIIVRIKGTGTNQEVVVPLNFHFHFHVHVHVQVHIHVHVHFG